MYGFCQRLAFEALELLSPTRCAGCERPGSLICDRCLGDLKRIDPTSSCPACGAPFGDVLCTECRGAGIGVDRCLSAVVFDDLASRIVRAYKDGGERRLAGPIAEAMFDCALRARVEADGRFGEALGALDAIVFVPATRAAYRRRGFDHMEAVAEGLARRMGLELVDALVKHGRSDQRRLGRLERREHAEGAYEVVAPVRGLRLLLVDDVITTGSTIRSSARALVDAGAVSVTALSFARVW